jgi:hypothetical protein
MSSGVTQVKKRFAEMATYLHKDDKGQQLLKLLKDDVNVLRTSLAAANAAKDAAAVSVETARQRADKAEVAAASLAESTRRLQDQISSLQSQVAILTQQLATKADSEDVVSTEEYDEAAAGNRVLKRLRKLKAKAPPTLPMDAIPAKDTEHRFIFERSKLATGWSDRDLWVIGATVAVLCSIDGIVTVMVSDMLNDPKRVSAKQLAASQGMLEDSMSWLRGLSPASVGTAHKTLSALVGRPTRLESSRTEEKTVMGLRLNVADGTVTSHRLLVDVDAKEHQA